MTGGSPLGVATASLVSLGGSVSSLAVLSVAFAAPLGSVGSVTSFGSTGSVVSTLLAQFDPERLLDPLVLRVAFVVGVVLVGAVIGYAVARFNRGLLRGLGVDEAVEGTAFERTVARFDSSTVSILAGLSGLFVFTMAVLVGLSAANVAVVLTFWNAVLGFLPQLFVASVVVIVGVIVGDKVELVVDERLRGVKLPEIMVVPTAAKWSVFYVAALIALAQIGVTTSALVVLLAAYAFAVVVVPAVAFRDLLSSAGAGLYLLLTEPYAIGDRVRIGEVEGVVQEIDLFTTRVASEEREIVIPNRQAFADGVIRVRE